MRKLIEKGVSLLFLTALLVGCQNTVKGVGQDMQVNGKAIQEAAEKK